MMRAIETMPTDPDRLGVAVIEGALQRLMELGIANRSDTPCHLREAVQSSAHFRAGPPGRHAELLVTWARQP